jgi:hypothetical protein
MIDELPDILSWIASVPAAGWIFAFYRATRAEEKSQTVFSRKEFSARIFRESMAFWVMLSVFCLISIIAIAGSIPILIIGLTASGAFYVLALAIYPWRFHKMAVFIWTIVLMGVISMSGIVLESSWATQALQLREDAYYSAHTTSLQEGETYVVSKGNISITMDKIEVVRVEGRASQENTTLPFVLAPGRQEVSLSFPTEQVVIRMCVSGIIQGTRKVYFMVGSNENLVCPEH